MPRQQHDSRTTMVPIPKGKRRSLCCSDNYRAFTLILISSVLDNVFDWVLILEEHNSLNNCDLKFGFKQYISTTHYTFDTTDIISYYNSNRGNVYTLLLVVDKAFDRVNYYQLFRRLLDRIISFLVLQLLRYMYTNQSLHVKWGNHVSDNFNAQNNVKQGGVLSHILFGVYMDCLFA